VVVGKAEKLNISRTSLHGAFFETEKAGARAMTDHMNRSMTLSPTRVLGAKINRKPF